MTLKAESTVWLINQFKKAGQVKDRNLLPFEVGDAAKIINVTPTELKDAVMKSQLLRGVEPPTAHLVNRKYYFFIPDLDAFNSRKTDFLRLQEKRMVIKC